MTLKDLSYKQLTRLFHRVMRSAGDGGLYGWDWPTLHAVFPAKYRLLKGIMAEARSR